MANKAGGGAVQASVETGGEEDTGISKVSGGVLFLWPDGGHMYLLLFFNLQAIHAYYLYNSKYHNNF